MYARKMGPYRSIENQEGSDNPVVAQAATNVIVFQCPCGTDGISRSPRRGNDL